MSNKCSSPQYTQESLATCLTATGAVVIAFTILGNDVTWVDNAIIASILCTLAAPLAVVCLVEEESMPIYAYCIYKDTTIYIYIQKIYDR